MKWSNKKNNEVRMKDTKTHNKFRPYTSSLNDQSIEILTKLFIFAAGSAF